MLAQRMMQAAAGSGVLVRDPYFKNTILLLKAPGANTTQNNTFIDSSTNNFTVTRNGDTTQGTFSPFSPNGWSNYFDGTGDYLQYINPANLALGTSDFTIEAWVYLTVAPATPGVVLFDVGPAGSGGSYRGYAAYLWRTGSVITFAYCPSGTVTYVDFGSSSTLTINVWHHIAFTKSGTSLKCFVDGVQSGSTATMSAAVIAPSGTDYLGIGGYDNTNNGLPGRWYVTGYISDFRIVIGTGYSSISVPTASLTAVTNTQLLTCQSNQFKDNSTNNYALVAAGNIAVQPFSPFAPTAAYSAATHGASIYFDGTGDYLTVADDANLEFGSGDFTAECWFYHTANTTVVLMCKRRGWSYYSGWSVVTNGALQIGCYITSAGGSFDLFNLSGAGSYSLNSWNHVALTRASNVFYLYLNGIQIGTSAPGATAIENHIYGVGIGAAADGSNIHSGYISDARFIKGTALYSGAGPITVPTAPLTAITNTQLLLSAKNGGIVDVSGKGDMETWGNVQSSSTQKKFAATSMYFDGTGDYLTTSAPASTFALGSGDFTIEFWIYRTAVATDQFIVEFRNATADSVRPTIWIHSDTVRLYVNTADRITGTTTLSINTWYHVAVSRSGTNTKLFINGVKEGATYTDSNVYLGTDFRPIIGANGTGASYLFTGYIEDLRITKGVARYGGFTAPAVTFAMLGETYAPYTTLLLKAVGANASQNNTFIDGSSNAFTVTRNGNTTQGAFSPFSPTGWSAYFDGTGDYLTIANNTALDPGSGDFTVECWFYPTSAPTTSVLFLRATTTCTYGIYYNSGALLGYASTVSGSWDLMSAGAVGTPTLNAWNHVVMVRTTTTLRTFLNGVAGATASVGTSTIYVPSNAFSIGAYNDASSPIFGYVSNFRFVKGTAVYTGAFTPPTTPLTAITNTQLLTCQSNRFIDSSSNAFAITVAGNSAIQPFSPFTPTVEYSSSTHGASAYFDGTGDWLNLAANSNLAPGSGDFTVEGWIYKTDAGVAYANIWSTQDGYGSNNELRISTGADGKTLTVSTNITNHISANVGFVLNAWNHFALVRISNALTMYQNGVSVGTATVSTNFTDNLAIIGRLGAGAYQYTGYISNLRLVKGTGVYTTTFTPPTSPLTAITNTQLLLSATNAGIVDTSTKVNLETLGNTQVSTSTYKFSKSMYFDGTGDYLLFPPTDGVVFRTGDFTIEMWVYQSVTSAEARLLDTRGLTLSALPLILSIYGAAGSYPNTIGVYDGVGWAVTSGFTPPLSTWYHIAVVRRSGVLSIYCNGVFYYGAANTTEINTSGSTLGNYIGRSTDAGYDFTGYIEDFRITKGYARYTGNFTPPTAALPSQ